MPKFYISAPDKDGFVHGKEKTLKSSQKIANILPDILLKKTYAGIESRHQRTQSFNINKCSSSL